MFTREGAMEKHTVLNEGSHPITVIMFAEVGVEKERHIVELGQSVTGYVTRIWHGHRRAQYKVTPATIE